jgi:chromosome segregation ATPase
MSENNDLTGSDGSNNINPNEVSPNDFTEQNRNGPSVDNQIDGIEYVKNLETTIENLKMEIDKFRHETINNEEVIHKVIHMKFDLESKLRELDETNQLMQKQFDEITTKLQVCDDDLIQKHIEALEFIQLKLKLEEDKDSIVAKLRQLDDNRKDLIDQIGFIDDELTILKTDNDQMTAQIKYHEEKMYYLTQRLTDMNTSILQLCAEVQHLRHKRTDLWNSVWKYFMNP